MQVKKQQLESAMEQQTDSKLERSTRLYIVTLLIWLLCRVHHGKCWVGWLKLESRLMVEISITSGMQMNTMGVGHGQGSLVCCSIWGCKVSDMTEWLNWTELLGRKTMTNLDSKFFNITLLWKVCVVKALFFPSSHVQIWELEHKEGWVLKSWSFWIMVLEKTLKRPFDCKDIIPINPIGNQLWIFIGSSDAEA